MTNNAVWKCVKKAKCFEAKNLSPKQTFECGPDEICCPERKPTPKSSVKNSTRPTTKALPSTSFAKANKIALDSEYPPIVISFDLSEREAKTAKTE